MDSEGSACASQGHPTDKCEREGGAGGGVSQQRCSKRLVSFPSSEERQRTHSASGGGGQSHDKVLRSHTRRANTSGGGVGPVEGSQKPGVLAGKQRSTPGKRGSLASKEDEHGGGFGSSEEGDKTKRGGDSEWSGMGGIIPLSSSCSPPTNETVELGEQAGLGGGNNTKAAIQTTTRARRTSGGKRRSRRGEQQPQPQCSSLASCPPDVATQSNTTTITAARSSSSNNRGDSGRVMSSVVGGADADTGRISEGCWDEQEMCQEDDAPAPHNPSSELSAQPSASNSPKSFASSVVSEGGSGSINPPKREHNEETEEASLHTVDKVETQCGSVGESGGRVNVGRKLLHKSEPQAGRLQVGSVETKGEESGRQVGTSQILQNLKGKWNAEDGREAEQAGKQTKPEEPHPMTVVDGIIMPFVRIHDVGQEGATEACISVPHPSSSSSATNNKLPPAATSSPRNSRKGGGSTGQKKPGGTSHSSKSGASVKSDVNSVPGSVHAVERKKAPVPAPMILMNNLPYMGELTFDTRPRRGRKPKKADICHLISKNYGIQFPVSYLNLAAAAAANPPTPPQPLPTPGHGSKTGHKRANSGAVNNGGPRSSSTIPLLGASPAPAFCNKDVSIVPIMSSSNWSPHGGTGGRATNKAAQRPVPGTSHNLLKPMSLAQQLSMLRPNVLPNNSSQQTISMFPLPATASYSRDQSRTPAPYKSEEEEEDEEMDGGSNLDRMNDDDDEKDGPLNLCMRDGGYNRAGFSFSLSRGGRKSEETSTLDVRWKKSTRIGQTHFGSSSPSPTLQLGANKRNVSVILPPDGEGMVRKSSKSAKLSGTQASSNRNSSSYRSSAGVGGSVNNLVRIEGIPNLSVSTSPVGEQRGRVNPSPTFSTAQRIQSREAIGCVNASYGMAAVGSIGNKGGKQGTSRKKREMGIQGDIRISPCNPEQHMGTSSAGSSAATSTGSLSSFGGTLFGQSTSGINDGAEVSICKFKFTGGAKPCLQEKKMLSVDSGGNFRFYTDKATAGTTSKVGKGQQPSSCPTSTVTSYSNSGSTYSTNNLTSDQFSVDGGAGTSECHLPMSSLPKSAKSMSMCMPFAGNSLGMSTVTSATLKAASPPVSSSSAGSSLPLPISPTTEELQQLHLGFNHGQQATREGSPYLPGEYSYSSSNSCSSSDNSNENVMQGDGVKMDVSSKSPSSSHPSPYHRHSTGGKLKRKRRTRKSLMREKLEKTFKEKGFLIQTQQLESAEGATYCKFRQLRKFTRYLFRSWKDYLPDHVKEISDKSNSNGANLPGSSQSTMSHPTLHNADGKMGDKDGQTAQKHAHDAASGDPFMEEEDDMDSDEKEDTDNEDREPGLISGKKQVEGSPSSDDLDEDEEKKAVLIEASRPPSVQSPSRSSKSSPVLASNPVVDENSSDEDEEELQVDS